MKTGTGSPKTSGWQCRTTAAASASPGAPAGLLEHAAEEHFGTEFLDYKLAVKTVASLDGALAHIARYSSRHSEAIVTENTIRMLEAASSIKSMALSGN